VIINAIGSSGEGRNPFGVDPGIRRSFGIT
jgi:hypothetical protein